MIEEINTSFYYRRFYSLVTSSNKSIGKKLKDNIHSLEDLCSDILDRHYGYETEQIKMKVLLHKHRFLQKLKEP